MSKHSEAFVAFDSWAEFDGCDEIEIGKEGFSQELKT